MRRVETGFAFDEIAKFGIFDDHFGPEGVARETEKESALISGGLDDDISPARNDMSGGGNFVIRKSVLDDVL